MKKGLIYYSLSGPAVVMLLVLSLPGYGAPALSPAIRESKIETIQSRLSEEKQKYKKFHSHEKNIMGQLAELERKVAETKRYIAESDEKIRLGRTRLKRLKQDLADIRDSLKKEEMGMADRLVALYKYARRAYITALITANDPDQFRRRLKYLKTIMEQDRRSLEELTLKKNKREEELARIKDKMAVIKADNDKEGEKLSRLKQDLEKKVIKLMKVHEEKKYYQTAVRELQAAAKDLKTTISAIEKKDTYKTGRQGGFEDAKGSLPFPVNGKIIIPERLSGTPSSLSYKGLFFEAASDAKVKAVYPGRVDFSGRIKGYGDVVVINHGSRYYTVSAHLLRRTCKEGDMVDEGMTIGLAGNDISSGDSRLYFEIRKGRKVLETLEWLKGSGS